MNESFSVGRALSLGFSIWFKNFIPFTILAVVLHIPQILYTWHIAGVFEGGSDQVMARLEDLQMFDRLSTVLGWVLNTLLAATLCYGVVNELSGKHVGMGAAVGQGLKRLLPVIGVWILMALILGGPFVLLLFMSPILALLWVVPFFMMLCMYYVAVPASVMEKPGIAGALARSRDLTAGRKGGVFGLILLLFLIAFAIGWIMKSVLLPDPQSFDDLDAFFKSIPTFLYANLGLDILFGTVGGVVTAVTYYLLRSEKEGTSADELALVFE